VHLKRWALRKEIPGWSQDIPLKRDRIRSHGANSGKKDGCKDAPIIT